MERRKCLIKKFNKMNFATSRSTRMRTEPIPLLKLLNFMFKFTQFHYYYYYYFIIIIIVSLFYIMGYTTSCFAKLWLISNLFSFFYTPCIASNNWCILYLQNHSSPSYRVRFKVEIFTRTEGEFWLSNFEPWWVSDHKFACRLLHVLKERREQLQYELI
jgi:hypothetical protein